MKVGVTGGEGFLGKYVLDALKNHSIKPILMDRKRQDILNPESLKEFIDECDAIIHLAGVNRGTPEDILRVNTMGTLGLLEGIAHFKKSVHLIFASSFQVYTHSTIYAISKKAAEDFISIYAKQNGIKSTVLRISNIYGPGGKPFYNSAIATFAYQLIQKEPITIFGGGDQKRDYIYASDAAEAFIKTLTYKKQNAVEYFDICSGENVSLKEIIEMLKTIYPNKFAVKYVQGNKEDILSIEKNYNKAKDLLGWKPKVPIEEGLKSLFA